MNKILSAPQQFRFGFNKQLKTSVTTVKDVGVFCTSRPCSAGSDAREDRKVRYSPSFGQEMGLSKVDRRR